MSKEQLRDDAMSSRIPGSAQAGRPVGDGKEIRRAAERLRGQLVHTPLIGDVLLPVQGGIVSAPRLKAECLQTGGSLEYRGAVHYLLRRLGSLKGLVCAGPGYRLLACARAAESQHLPMLALCEQSLPRHHRELIAACGGVVEEAAATAAATRLAAAVRETGHHLLPGVESEDYALGIATLGLELGGELPRDVARVYVSPSELAPAIAAGLLASGHGAQVMAVEVTSETASLARLQRALLDGTNLHSDAVGIAAMSQSLADGDVDRSCAILSC